jgi:hypothetical protein
MPKRQKKHARESLAIVDKSSDDCPYELTSVCRDEKFEKASIFCVKFNQHHDGLVFAAGVLNKVLIFDAENDITLLRTYDMPVNESIYALDWSLKSISGEMVRNIATILIRISSNFECLFSGAGRRWF